MSMLPSAMSMLDSNLGTMRVLPHVDQLRGFIALKEKEDRELRQEIADIWLAQHSQYLRQIRKLMAKVDSLSKRLTSLKLKRKRMHRGLRLLCSLLHHRWKRP